jgi:hypothetical protein
MGALEALRQLDHRLNSIAATPASSPLPAEPLDEATRQWLEESTRCTSLDGVSLRYTLPVAVDPAVAHLGDYLRDRLALLRHAPTYRDEET